MGQICTYCNGKKHFARQCFFNKGEKSKRVHNIEDASETESEPDYSDFFVDSIDSESKGGKYKLKSKLMGNISTINLTLVVRSISCP